MRIDKWLWVARFCKTRSGASKLCVEGRVTVNGKNVDKAQVLREGDTVGVPGGGGRRLVRVLAFSERRLGPPQAVFLYEEIPPFDDAQQNDAAEG